MKFAFVLVLAGCLSKPPVPTAGDAGDDARAGDDGGIDAPPACSGNNHFATTFVPEHIARLMDFDRNGSDDLIVFGRVPGATPAAHAYVVLGRTPMNLECYDYDFTLSMAGDLIDIWVGEITGDGIPDIAMLANTGTNYLIELYPGRNQIGGGVLTRITQMVPNNAFGLVGDIGGTPGNRSPAFLSAFRHDGLTGMIFGGLHQPFAVAPFNGTGFTAVVPAWSGANAGFGELDSAEGVWANEFAAKRDEFVVATSAGSLRVLRHLTTDTSAARFEVPAAPINVNVGIDGGGRNRTVRVWNHAYEGDATIAVAEGEVDQNIAILAYHTYVDPTGGFSSVHINVPMDFAGGYGNVYDFALGNLDGNRSEPVDVIALTGTGSTARRLSIHRNLNPQQNPGGVLGRIGFAETLTTMNISGNTLAVGNFDGNASSPDQILVLGAPTGGSLGVCYEVINQTSTACISRCGEMTCL